MVTRGRNFLVAVVLTGVIGLSDSPSLSQVHGCGGRPLFGGGLLAHRQCKPMIVEICVPIPKKPLQEPEPPPQEPEPPAVSKDLRVNVKNIADLLKRGKAAAARKLAVAAAQDIEEVADLMHLYRQRNKGGLGWGSKAQANPVQDGLERGIQAIARGSPNENDNNEESAYWIAAMAELTLAKAPRLRGAAKINQPWVDNVERLRVASAEFAKASAANNALKMQVAATKINTACVSCHSKFKE